MKTTISQYYDIVKYIGKYPNMNIDKVVPTQQNGLAGETLTTTNIKSELLLNRFLPLKPSNTLALGTIVTNETSDGILPPDPVRVLEKHRTLTENYLDLCKKGYIIMNPYSARSVFAEYPPCIISSVEKTIKYTFVDNVWPDPWVKYTLLQPWTNFKKTYNLYDDPFLFRFSSTSSQLRLVEKKDVIGFARNANKLIFKLSEPDEIDHALVQSCLADANDGELDILTAIGEGPETVHSIINGLKTITRLLRDFRTRELALTAAAAKKAVNKRKKELAEKRLRNFPSLRRFVRRGGKEEDYAKFRREYMLETEQRLKRINEKSIALAKDEIRELGDAISGVWLNYRYNIMPNVHTIVDALSAVDRQHQVYRTFRSKKTIAAPVEQDGFMTVNDREEIHRVTIKRKYVVLDNKLDILSALSMDVLVTALELVPLWGVVINWFCSASETLKALTWCPKYESQKCSYSRKVILKGNLYDMQSGSGNYLSRPYVDLNVATYHRDILNPLDSIGLYFKLNMNQMRQLDAIAFSWNKFKKKI